MTDALLVLIAVLFALDIYFTRKWTRVSRQAIDEIQTSTKLIISAREAAERD